MPVVLDTMMGRSDRKALLSMGLVDVETVPVGIVVGASVETKECFGKVYIVNGSTFSYTLLPCFRADRPWATTEEW